MTTINSVGNGLSGSTGSGNFVGANTPTLITPVLGAATATSINFGGSTLSNYVSEASWTPVFTFGTPGNLSVSYSVQFGSYTRIGSVVYYMFVVGCTPTFTTSSGEAQITGLPLTCIGVSFPGSVLGTSTNMTYPAGTTVAYTNVQASSTLIVLSAAGSTVSSTAFSTANFVTGQSLSLTAAGYYFV